MKSKRILYEELYADTREDLFAFIMKSVRQEHIALDILQDAFLNFIRIFNNRPLLDKVQSRMYLFKIARNLLINRSKNAYIRRVDLVAEYAEGRGNERQRHDEFEKRIIDNLHLEEADKVLGEIMDSLKEEERTALLLRYNLNMRLEEMAKIMDVSVSTASRLVRRAAAKMVKQAKIRGFSIEITN